MPVAVASGLALSLAVFDCTLTRPLDYLHEGAPDAADAGSSGDAKLDAGGDANGPAPRIFVIGGRASLEGGVPEATSTVLYTELNGVEPLQWNRVEGLLGKVAFGAAAVVGDWLFVLGGTDALEIPTNRVWRSAVGGVDAAGIASQWLSLETFNGERLRFGAASTTGHLYVIGGQSSGASLGDVQLGSVDPNGDVTWATATGLPASRHDHAVVSIGDRLYVIGGASTDLDAGGLDDVLAAPLAADGSLAGAWSVAGTGQFLSQGCAVAHGDWVFWIGGLGDFTGVWRAHRNTTDGTLGTLEKYTNAVLTAGRTFHGCVVAGGHLYVIGGYNKNDALSSIERWTIDDNGNLGDHRDDLALPEGRYAAAVAAWPEAP